MKKKMLLIPAFALSGMLTAVSALEWKDVQPRVPVAGKYTGTGVYVRKRSTGFTDTYANFFSGNGRDGSFFDGKYNVYAPKYVAGFQRLTYDGSMATTVNKLTIQLEGWSTLVSSDSRWEGHLYSAMMPTSDYATGEYTLHATNRAVDGNLANGAISTNNPYVFVENGDNLIIGNPNTKAYGLVFDWKSAGYRDDPTLDSRAVVDVRGNFFANIKTQQDGNLANKLIYDMKISANGMFTGTVDLNTKVSEAVFDIYSNDGVTAFTNLWQTKRTHRIELTASSGHLDGGAGKNEFLIGNLATTMFLTGGNYRGGSGLKIHAKEGGQVMLYNESNQLHIGSLSASNNANIVVVHRENLVVDDLAFGTWDYNASTPGAISGGVTRNARIDFDSRGDLTINNFRGNKEQNSNNVIVRLKDSRGGLNFNLKTDANKVNWKVGVRDGTTLNLYGTDNRFAEIWKSGGRPNFKINALANNKTIIGIDRLWHNVVREGNIAVDMYTRKGGKSDIFYIKELLEPKAENGNVIKIVPKINTWDDRKSVIGEIIGYTPKNYVDVQKEILWNPGNGVLKNGFKIVLGTFNEGNNHTGWMIKDYIMLGVDDKENIGFDPDDGFNCGPGFECGQLDPSMGKPDVDNDAGFNPGLESGLDKPEPPKPEPTPPGPDEGETEKPKPPTDGDGNKPVTPPDQGGDGGNKPVEPNPEPTPDPKPEEKPEQKPDQPIQPDQPVTPPSKPDVPEQKPDQPGKPEDKPEEKPEEKPQPPVNNGSVFTETFTRTVSARVEQTRSLFLVNFNSINKRLGDLRTNENEHGVWTRGFVGGHDNSTFWTLQAGYDNQILKTDAYSFYLGIAGSYSKDDITDMGEVAMYMSYIQDSGWYNDTIVKFAIMNSKSVVKDFMHYGVIFSDEIGYRFNINGFFIDPQVELSLGYLTGADFQDIYTDPTSGMSSLVNASFTDSIHFRARFGASTGYNHVFEDKGIKLQGYVGLFGEADKFTQSKGRVGAYGYNEIYGSAYTDDIRMVLNVGTNVDFRDNGRLYVDFEKSFFGDFNIDWKVNLGYRYSFGKKEVTVHDVVKEDVAPVKLKSEQKEEAKKVVEKQPAKQEVKTSKKPKAKKTASTKSKKKVAAKTKKAETKKVAKVDRKKSSGWFLK